MKDADHYMEHRIYWDTYAVDHRLNGGVSCIGPRTFDQISLFTGGHVPPCVPTDQEVTIYRVGLHVVCSHLDTFAMIDGSLQPEAVYMKQCHERETTHHAVGRVTPQDRRCASGHDGALGLFRWYPLDVPIQICGGDTFQLVLQLTPEAAHALDELEAPLVPGSYGYVRAVLDGDRAYTDMSARVAPAAASGNARYWSTWGADTRYAGTLGAQGAARFGEVEDKERVCLEHTFFNDVDPRRGNLPVSCMMLHPFVIERLQLSVTSSDPALSHDLAAAGALQLDVADRTALELLCDVPLYAPNTPELGESTSQGLHKAIGELVLRHPIQLGARQNFCVRLKVLSRRLADRLVHLMRGGEANSYTSITVTLIGSDAHEG